MSSQLKPPLDVNPGDSVSLSAAMQFVLRSFAKDLECCLPAIVQEYDAKNNVATVRPLIAYTLRSGDKRARNPLVSIPVLSIGAGGFHIHVPLRKGDLGWIFAADRDTSLFMQSLEENPANTIRTHSFADGLFIPDAFRNYELNDEDSGAMVLQSTDGKTRISIREDNIKITAESDVTIDSQNVHILHDAAIDGKLTVTDVDVIGILKVGIVTVNTHTHVDPQGGTVGPMQ